MLYSCFWKIGSQLHGHCAYFDPILTRGWKNKLHGSDVIDASIGRHCGHDELWPHRIHMRFTLYSTWSSSVLRNLISAQRNYQSSCTVSTFKPFFIHSCLYQEEKFIYLISLLNSELQACWVLWVTILNRTDPIWK